MKEAGIEKLNTPMKKRIKVLKRQMKRQAKKELANPMKSSIDSPCSSSTSLEPERLYVSKAIWGHMSPRSKHKVTYVLNISPNVPKGFNSDVRKVLWLNYSKSMEVAQKKETPLQKEIWMFYRKTEIARPCLNTQRMVADPSERGKRVPARYHLGTMRVLYWRFEAET